MPCYCLVRHISPKNSACEPTHQVVAFSFKRDDLAQKELTEMLTELNERIEKMPCVSYSIEHHRVNVDGRDLALIYATKRKRTTSY